MSGADSMSGVEDIRGLLKESILKLCAISVPQGLGIEVDGIICISLPGDDLRQIVVKVHETLDKQRTDQLLGVGASGMVPSSDRQDQRSMAASRPASRSPANLATVTECPEDSHTSPTQPLNRDSPPLRDSPKPPCQDSTELGEVKALDLSAISNQVPCEYCHLLLPSTKALRQHWKKIHKAIVCTHCYHPFITQATYLKHLETHINEIPTKRGPGRPKGSVAQMGKVSNLVLPTIKNRGSLVESKCGVCGDMQPQDVIIKHMVDYHYLEHCFTCQQCVEYFPNRQTLVVHRRLSHANVTEVKCSMCDVAFYSWEFASHLKECADADVDHDDNDNLAKKRPRSSSPDALQHPVYLRKKIKKETPIKITNGSEKDKSAITVKEEPLNSSFVSNGERKMQPLDMSLDSTLENSQLSPELEDEDSSNAIQQPKLNFEDGLPVFYKQTGVNNAPAIPPALGPFRCSLCDQLTVNIKEFGKHNYDSHYRFTCPFCAQTFATKRNVRRHMRKHTGHKPYSCDSCEQTFYRNDDLRRHRVNVHDKLYTCIYCQHCHRIYTKLEMEDHLLLQHSFTRAKITDEELAQHIHAKPSDKDSGVMLAVP